MSKLKIHLPAILLLSFASFASAQGVRHASETPATFASRVAAAFEGKNLASLDTTPRRGVKVTFGHSLGDDDPDRLKSRTFSTLKGVQSWIRSQTGRDANFEGGRLRRCRGSRCDFVREGMLHNHLYLVNFTYGVSRGTYYIKTIRFIDGD